MRTSLLWGIPVSVLMLVPLQKAMCQITSAGARSCALAGISAGLEDVWAAANNPAGLARYDHVSLATSLEQRYLMKELGYYGIAASVPAGNGCLGLFTQFSGYQSFIEQKVSLAYGRLFGEHLLAGINLVYVYQKAGTETQSVHLVSYGLGTTIILSKKLSLAVSAFNPFQLYYRSENYASLPSFFKLGLTYQYSASLIIYSECDKDLELPLEFKLGTEYIFRGIFFIRCGISLFPVSWSFGAAVRHQRYLFEFSTRYHQYLGFTPSVSLQIDIK
jgi:hypothetical protein